MKVAGDANYAAAMVCRWMKAAGDANDSAEWLRAAGGCQPASLKVAAGDADYSAGAQCRLPTYKSNV